MNVTICPTITTDDPATYQLQIEKSLEFAGRLHIDLADGEFAPRLVRIEDVWWPGGIQADLHVMYKNPFEYTSELVALRPQLVIVHAEAEGNFLNFADDLHAHGIEAGVALLPETEVKSIKPAIKQIDHVMIFSGHLGHFGGHADLTLLTKVKQIKALKPSIEIGWDGGVNDKNAAALAEGGIEVLNAGGYLHGASDPKSAYDTLRMLVEKSDR